MGTFKPRFPRAASFRSWTRMKFQTVFCKAHFRLNMIRRRRCSLLSMLHRNHRISIMLHFHSFPTNSVSVVSVPVSLRDCFVQIRVRHRFAAAFCQSERHRSNSGITRGNSESPSLCISRATFMKDVRFKWTAFRCFPPFFVVPYNNWAAHRLNRVTPQKKMSKVPFNIKS